MIEITIEYHLVSIEFIIGNTIFEIFHNVVHEHTYFDTIPYIRMSKLYGMNNDYTPRWYFHNNNNNLVVGPEIVPHRYSKTAAIDHFTIIWHSMSGILVSYDKFARKYDGDVELYKIFMKYYDEMLQVYISNIKMNF